MKRVSRWAMMALVPALSAMLVVGCGGGSTGTGGGSGGGTGGGTGGGKKDGSGGGKEAGAKKGALTELESKGAGTLKGKVAIAAPPANLAEMTKSVQDQMGKKDKDCCLNEKAPAADKEQQTWRIKDGGLGNVFVWVAPPSGKFFKVDTSKKTWQDEVTMDQPYCAFEPHAFVLFPAMKDPANPKKMIPTGQKFLVKNSAPINHNTNWKGGPENPGDNKIVPPGGKLEVNLEPSPKEVTFKCDIHGWMSAYGRVFDHPYATVSKEDGTFEIKGVPAGVPVKVVAWHEAAGYLTPEEGIEVTLEDGKDKVQNLEAKAK